MKNKILYGLLVGAAAFLIALLLHSLHLFQALEWKSWDARLRLFSNPEHASQDIVLILVDQKSLDVYTKQQSLSWPWPRQLYAALVEYLKRGGCQACFFDIAMSEGSPFGVEDDEILGSAAAAAGNVFFPVFLSTEDKESDETAVGLLSRFSLKKAKASASGETFRSLTAPLEIFVKAAKGIGNVRFIPDKDGIFRRIPLSFVFRDMILPSLPLAIAEAVGKLTDSSSLPVDSTGSLIIHFQGPTGTYRTYSIVALINSWAQMAEGRKPQVPPQEFAGKIALVGLSAFGLLDLKSSPLSAVMPGVEILAATLDTLLQRNFFRPAPGAISYAFVLFLALLTGAAVSSLRKIGLIIGAFIVFMAVPAAAACGAFIAGIWLEFVFPWAAVFLALIGASVLNYSLEGKQRRFIKGVFRHYLSPAVIDRIIENPKLLQLGGEEREITSFFSDVAGFTSITEKLTPHELVALLNAYLSEMTGIILREGGTLDKYEGDAIVAFWNAPLDDPDHVLRACRAALACQKRLAVIEADFQKQFGHGLRARIGLNTGPAVVGNMGSSRRFDYTAMGDTVNLAARLESACKQYSVSILAGEKTFDRVKDRMIGREIDLVRVVGKKQPVRIFELIAEKGVLPQEEIDQVRLYHQALELYRNRQWDEAVACFKKLAGDPPAGIYMDRCLSLKQNPPSSEWDGVTDLRTK